MALHLELHSKEAVVGCISSSPDSKEDFAGTLCQGVSDNEVLIG